MHGNLRESILIFEKKWRFSVHEAVTVVAVLLSNVVKLTWCSGGGEKGTVSKQELVMPLAIAAIRRAAESLKREQPFVTVEALGRVMKSKSSVVRSYVEHIEGLAAEIGLQPGGAYSTNALKVR